jgi:hypothetical protein
MVGGALPKGVSATTLLSALRHAADSWNNVPCADIHIEVSSERLDSIAVEADGVNLVVVHNVTWCADERGRSCHSELNPALTSVRFRPPGGRNTPGVASKADIHEVDIEINAVGFRWDDQSRADSASISRALGLKSDGAVLVAR